MLSLSSLIRRDSLFVCMYVPWSYVTRTTNKNTNAKKEENPYFSLFLSCLRLSHGDQERTTAENRGERKECRRHPQTYTHTHTRKSIEIRRKRKDRERERKKERERDRAVARKQQSESHQHHPHLVIVPNKTIIFFFLYRHGQAQAHSS